MVSEQQEIEKSISVIIASTSCILSCIGSALIIGTYACYPQIRKPARSLLFWLSITDLGTALSYSFTFILCGLSCHCRSSEIFTLLGIYFPVSSFLWTDCIGLYIYAATYQKTWIAPRERLFATFHVICWGLPLLTCITIIILDAVPNVTVQIGGSVTGGWCWLQQWEYDLLGGKVIEIFSYVFLMAVYVLTWMELKRVNPQYNKSKAGGSIMLHSGSNKNQSPTQQTFIHPVPTPSTSYTVKGSQHNNNITNSNGNNGNNGHFLTVPVSQQSMIKETRSSDMRKRLSTRHKREAVNRLLFIPVVFFFLRIWGTLHMIVDIWEADKTHGVWYVVDQGLAFLQALCDPLQGFCNGILFVVFVTEVRQHLYGTLRKYVGDKWLNYCGLICCCHYCCSCLCSGCNECCECCIVKGGTDLYHNMNDPMMNRGYTNNHSPGGQQQQFNTNYYAAQYHFLPPTKNEKNNGKDLLIKGHDRPTIESPSISEK